jgi:arylsulfatase A-like enzyme
MTSLYPLTHGVRGFNDRLPAVATTIAEKYRDAGYATLALSSVLFTGQFTNLHQGFEELHESGSASVPGPKTAREYVDRVKAWLTLHRDVPFFIYLHVFDPHDPFEPYRPYDTLWADPTLKADHEAELERVREVIDDPLRRNFGMPYRTELEEVDVDPDTYVAYDEDWYDGSIRAMDVEMGRLVETLRSLDLDEETLIVFTSDHGEEFLDHGRMFHGQTVYGELTRVPLVFRWPGTIPGGLTIDEHTQLVDIMPTLMEISGLTAVEEMQGQSLVPLVHGDAPSGWDTRPVFSEKAATNDNFSPPPRNTESYAVSVGPWKLIQNRIRSEGMPEFELYETESDPLDLLDVSSEHQDVVEDLAREIDRWYRISEAARLPDDSESSEGLTQDQLERLRSLGYIR